MNLSSRSPEDQPDQCPRCGNPTVIEPSKPEGDIPCRHCGGLLWFVRRPAGEAVILTFLPGLILASESLHRAKEVLPAVGEASQVILNLTHVPFMSSTFLNMLVALNRLLGPEGKTLMLFGLHPDFVEIFKVMKIDSLFLIYEDERAALLAAKGCEPSQD
jgi:anti-sigma B factor antagonist